MAANNFKAFALDPNANVMSQADWEALPALLSGFTAGKASSAQVNKALRQATTIGALVGQFIANSGADALDNADVNGLVTKFTNALTTNLSLGTASKRNVGTGANQIPDMNSFPSGSNWFQLPSGHIVQIFSMNVLGTDANGTSANYPIAFPTAMMSVSALWGDGTVANGPTYKLMGNATNRTTLTLKVSASSGSYGTMIIAVGR
ncbi:phage tail protein [Escherichia coli]|uniref:gp53-like domain-containing protein n=1 Tax=Escherichia coli TaxID=562 RepID=UPI0021696C43|nr:phage tail protein [Escherichia coli]